MVDSTSPDNWLDRAMVDLRSAEVNAHHDIDGLAPAICYSCQQAAEKALKAFVLLRGESLVRGHDLLFLLGKCIEFDPSFKRLEDAVAVLNDYAVEARYPSDFPDRHTGEIANEALTLVRTCLKLVGDKFGRNVI